MPNSQTPLPEEAPNWYDEVVDFRALVYSYTQALPNRSAGTDNWKKLLTQFAVDMVSRARHSTRPHPKIAAYIRAVTPWLGNAIKEEGGTITYADKTQLCRESSRMAELTVVTTTPLQKSNALPNLLDKANKLQDNRKLAQDYLDSLRAFATETLIELAEISRTHALKTDWQPPPPEAPLILSLTLLHISFLTRFSQNGQHITGRNLAHQRGTGLGSSSQVADCPPDQSRKPSGETNGPVG
jgi:hypothetical protein